MSNSGSPSAANSGKFYAVKVDKTGFFRFGPQQANGPDQQLTKDTLMTLIRPSFGYCKVKLMTGEDGYVANEDIEVASQALVSAATATPTPAPSQQFDINSLDPRLAVPQEKLPDPDLPPDSSGR